MSVGSRARSLLGPAFPLAGRAYRRLFVDLRKVAAAIPEVDGVLLDVGGGDGALLNHLLDRQPRLRVVAIDIADEIGGLLRPDLRARVDVRPATSVRQFVDAGGRADAVLICDVLHHVPPPQRADLLRDVFNVFGEGPPHVAVKEVYPRGLRSRLGFWADRNISGDRGVRPLFPNEVESLVASVRPGLQARMTPLLQEDRPNYVVVFSEPEDAQR